MALFYPRDMPKTIATLTQPLVEALWPSACPLCHTPTAPPQALCAHCWLKIRLISGVCCKYCGVPMLSAYSQSCQACETSPRNWDFGYACTQYQGEARDIVLRLKHGRQIALATIIAKLMVLSRGEGLAHVDALIAMPCHWSRRVHRGFNQAELIADELAIRLNIPHFRGVLKRQKKTKTQGVAGNYSARFDNVKSAFMLNPRQAHQLAGRKILIIDDVMTSGASLEFAARALRLANPAEIGVFVFARAA